MALVQGMRRIADLARMSVLGALFGTVFRIPIVYFYGANGVDYTPQAIGNILRDMGLSPQRPLVRAYEQDPERVRRWKEEEYPAIVKAGSICW